MDPKLRIDDLEWDGKEDNFTRGPRLGQIYDFKKKRKYLTTSTMLNKKYLENDAYLRVKEINVFLQIKFLQISFESSGRYLFSTLGCSLLLLFVFSLSPILVISL